MLGKWNMLNNIWAQMSHEKEASILQNITNIAMKQAKFKD
jgi:hypothetical protein